MPADSTTARTAPPAMTPVPGAPGAAAPAGAEVAGHVVRHRRADHRHLEHVLARLVVALADGFRNLVRLAEADAHVTRLVADDDQRREAEAPAALHDLRDAVDVDHALFELFFVDVFDGHAAGP